MNEGSSSECVCEPSIFLRRCWSGGQSRSVAKVDLPPSPLAPVPLCFFVVNGITVQWVIQVTTWLSYLILPAPWLPMSNHAAASLGSVFLHLTNFACILVMCPALGSVGTMGSLCSPACNPEGIKTEGIKTEEVAESISHPLCTSAYGGRVGKRQAWRSASDLRITHCH